MDYIRGIDVSQIQGDIAWDKVAAAGIRFAILKCSTGNDGIDAKFAQNLTGARAAGITIGLYQFVYPIGLPDAPGHSNRTAVEQAKYHFGASKGLGCSAGDIRPFMDCEWPETAADWAKYGCSENQIRDYLLAYKQQYEIEAGTAIGIYTDKYWWQQIHGEQFDGLLSCDFWSADPQRRCPLPAEGTAPFLYPPFYNWSVWQYSWSLIVPGIVDKVDGDCIPDEATLTALTTR